MRRALAILKYIPAVLCGLLAVAWVVSLRGHAGGLRHYDGQSIRIDTYYPASILWARDLGAFSAEPIRFYYHDRPAHWTKWTGELHLLFNLPGELVSVPIPLILTLLLPTTLAPFRSFRFPLSSYFAWTALLAVELGYYLR